MSHLAQSRSSIIAIIAITAFIINIIIIIIIISIIIIIIIITYYHHTCCMKQLSDAWRSQQEQLADCCNTGITKETDTHIHRHSHIYRHRHTHTNLNHSRNIPTPPTLALHLPPSKAIAWCSSQKKHESTSSPVSPHPTTSPCPVKPILAGNEDAVTNGCWLRGCTNLLTTKAKLQGRGSLFQFGCCQWRSSWRCERARGVARGWCRGGQRRWQQQQKRSRKTCD